MGEDENLQKDMKKQEEQDASKKALKTGAKAAANAYLGPAGGKAVDLASKTKLGDNILNKGAESINKKAPKIGKIANAANKSGALDAADKAVDATSGGVDSLGKDVLPPEEGLIDKSNNIDGNIIGNNNEITDNEDDNNPFNSFFDTFNHSPQNNLDNNTNNSLEKFIKKHKFKLILIISSVFLLIIIIVTIISAIYSVGDVFTNFISGIKEFFTEDQQKLEEEYYEELQQTQTDIHNKYGICIDANLITAALTINKSFDESLDESKDEVEDEIDGEEAETVSYKQMKKQIKLLANMQIMTKKYSYDKNYKASNGDYCKDEETTELVTADNESSFERGFFSWLVESKNIDSSTPELIASNDVSNFSAFFTKKSSEEKNYAYYLYYPKATYTETKDTNGNMVRTRSCKSSKDDLPKEQYEISIGDLSTMQDSVFYWNLVNSFIPDYYADYLPESEPARTEKAKKIAEDIYLLYQDMGHSQSCSMSYNGPSALCPDGITVDGVGTLELEEYVAGVVSNEAYTSEGMEALKAQAVAARTYAVNLTNYCQNSIGNSTNSQTFTRNVNDRAKEATISTSGEILQYNGSIFSSQYDSFCYEDSDCKDAKRNSDGTYSVTYTKLPNGEKHTITLSDSSQYGRILPGQGHAHGMSQLLSYQLAKEGKSYQEILSYFYSDGVTISLVLSPSTTEGGTIINHPIEEYLSKAGTNISNMNQTIYSQVRKAGLGTREGVVAAAVTLINNFYSKTGYLLPYELYPSGKYSGYGMDPTWGSNTGRADYSSNGLDCSGFISWAIHNGGFQYDVRSAQGWGNVGVSRAWSTGMNDTAAKPGDLIYNKPQSANGTTGHIRMIVDVTNEGYVVAEASSKKNGVRIKTISFTSTGNYYLINMDNYYANATKVTDYPQ